MPLSSSSSSQESAFYEVKVSYGTEEEEHNSSSSSSSSSTPRSDVIPLHPSGSSCLAETQRPLQQWPALPPPPLVARVLAPDFPPQAHLFGSASPTGSFSSGGNDAAAAASYPTAAGPCFPRLPEVPPPGMVRSKTSSSKISESTAVAVDASPRQGEYAPLLNPAHSSVPDSALGGVEEGAGATGAKGRPPTDFFDAARTLVASSQVMPPEGTPISLQTLPASTTTTSAIETGGGSLAASPKVNLQKSTEALSLPAAHGGTTVLTPRATEVAEQQRGAVHTLTTVLPPLSLPDTATPREDRDPGSPEPPYSSGGRIDEPAQAPTCSGPSSELLPVKSSQRRHLRRKRSALEVDRQDLFSTLHSQPNVFPHVVRASSSRSRSSSRSSADDADSEIFVGRTRRPGVPLKDRYKKRHGDTSIPEAARNTELNSEARLPSAPLSSAAPHVPNGWKAPFASTPHGKASSSSQSTNALTSDGSDQLGPKLGHHKHNFVDKRGNPVTKGLPKSYHPDSSAAVDAVMSSTSSCPSTDTSTQLVFTSPAAQFYTRCKQENEREGSKGRKAHSLTRAALMASASSRAAPREENTGAARTSNIYHSEGPLLGAERTVRFRSAGASNEEVRPSSQQRLAGASGSSHRTGNVDSSHSSLIAASAACRLEGTVVKLRIRGMSPLHADVSVVHPFVRAWVVSCVSGRSLVEAAASVPCAVTQPFDLRAHKSRAPWWDAEVALRLAPEKLRAVASDAMLLLEVLDFGNETIQGFPLYRRGLYPICWGFLMLHDCVGHSNLFAAENLHIQLYRFPSRTPWYLALLTSLLPLSWSVAAARLRPADVRRACGYGGAHVSLGDGGGDDEAGSIANDVPPIYTIFANAGNRKIPYEGCLVLSVQQAGSDNEALPQVTNMLPYEEYLLATLVAGGGSTAMPRSSRETFALESGSYDPDDLGGTYRGPRGAAVPPSPWNLASAATTGAYYRMDGERSLLPHEILQRAAVLGAVTSVTFTHNGSLLAFGICRHLQHIIELRSPLLPTIPVVATLVGHTGHIHRLVFQKEDRYLLSCSSDGTVRVWQQNSPAAIFAAESCCGSDSVECVCTLPHGFPVYAAIFHQGKIVTGGFNDQLYVWDYERSFPEELLSTTTTEDTTLRLTATFTPEIQTTVLSHDSSRTPRALLGELVYRVDAAGALAEEAESTVTLSLASNERSNRVWSVHGRGFVVCWRAILSVEEGRKGGESASCHWQMSLRHRADCDGATEVQVKGTYAIVTCSSAPLVFVFDATTCEQLRVVNIHSSPAAPIYLLPDGESFVTSIGDAGKLLAWDCFDGGLCTPTSGYSKTAPLFSIARMAWAESLQLAVFVSRFPCPEAEVMRYEQAAETPVAGQSSTGFWYRQQEQQSHFLSVPSELTLVTVAGTLRRKGTVILTTDRHASDAFVSMFGGELQPKRKATYIAEREKAVRERRAERDTRKERLHENSLAPASAAVFAGSAATGIPYDATEKGARVNAIINFWRGLVGQHRHTEADLGSPISIPSGSPTQSGEQRAMQYAEMDNDEI